MLAAQKLGDDSFVPAKKKELPNEVRELIKQAKSNLQKAMKLWQPLHDPEPERPDQNFKHNNKEYNYRAKETHRILNNLKNGVLTEYRFETPKSERKTPMDKKRFFKTIATKVAKGGIKSLPFVGGVLEEAIFGVMDAEDARKEAAKLQFAISQLQRSTDTQNKSLQEMFQFLKENADLSSKTETIIDDMSTEAGLADLDARIERVAKKRRIDVVKFEGNSDKFGDLLEEQLRPEIVTRIKLLTKLSSLRHAKLDLLVAALGASYVVPDSRQNRESRSAKLVTWVERPDGKGLPELVFTARALDLTGFSRAIPEIE